MNKDLALPGPDVPVIDETRLMNEFGGDAEILAELRDLFLGHAPPLFEAICQALDDDDASIIARDAHSLKGACSTYGAPRLAMVCKEFELAAKAGELQSLKENRGVLEEEYRKVFEAIGEISVG